MVFVRSQFGAELAQVVVEHHADGIRAIAVHVDQRIEAALRAGKQPVDGTLLVALHMVAVEILEEVVADVAGFAVFAQRGFDEFEIILVVFLAKGDAQELAKTC